MHSMEEDVSAPVAILRIKRKRGAPVAALDALVFKSDDAQGSSSKRMRLQKQTDVEQPTFKFAETVASTSFADAAQQDALTKRVRSLMSNGASLQSGCQESGSAHSPSTNPEAHTPSPRRRSKRVKYRVVTSAKMASASGLHVVDLEQDISAPATPVRQPVTRPGTAGQQAHDRQRRSLEEASARKRQMQDQILMASFMPMLRDYLSLEDRQELSASPSFDSVRHLAPPADVIPEENASTNVNDSDDEDYVYDIYYKASDESALASTLPAAARIGQLSMLDVDDILVDPADAISSDEELGDEADQDSNDEGFFANDYPDEEKDLEDSDPDSFIASDHSDGDEAWR